MKGSKNSGYTPIKLLEFAANNNYISKPHTKDDSSISLGAKSPSVLSSQDDITLGSKDKTIDSAKQEYLNLDSKTKAECHLKWFFSLNDEEKTYHSKSWKEGEGVSPNSLEMAEVLQTVYSGLNDEQSQDLVKRFKEYDYCGIGLDRVSMTVALNSFATEFNKQNPESDLQKQLNIGSEKVSTDNPMSFQAYKVLLTMAVSLGIMPIGVAAQCKGDPNIACPPTFSPTSFPSFFPTLDPTLMPTLSPSFLIDELINKTLSPSETPSSSPSLSPSSSPSLISFINQTYSHDAEENNHWWDEDKPWVYLLGAGVVISVCCGAACLLSDSGRKKVTSAVEVEFTEADMSANLGVRFEKLSGSKYIHEGHDII